MENEYHLTEKVCVVCGAVNSHTICSYCAAKLKASEGVDFIGD